MSENDKNRNSQEIPMGMDQVAADFQDSLLQGGLRLSEMKDGEAFEIETASGSIYKLASKDGQLFISGGSRNFPEGTPVKINGAVGLGSSIMPGVILRGKKIQMIHPTKPDALLATDFVTEITHINSKTPPSNV